jgi:hypothetical protein
MKEMQLIVGDSDSGKDFIAKKLFNNHKLLKCASAFKRVFEIDHHLETGACDDKRLRISILKSGPLAGLTLSDAMVLTYEQSILREGYGAKFATVGIMGVLQDVIKATGQCVCITDVRKPTELTMLVTLAEVMGYETRLWHVVSNRSTKKASDDLLESNIALYEKLTNRKAVTYINNY